MDGEGEKTTRLRERIAKKKSKKIFFMFGRWISFPFRGSIMDIFNAAQHALPLGPPALERSFFILFRISRAPSLQFIALDKSGGKKKWKMWCGSREENCNLVFVFPISSIQRNGQSESGEREMGWQLKRKMLWRSLMFDCNLFTYEGRRREKASKMWTAVAHWLGDKRRLVTGTCSLSYPEHSCVWRSISIEQPTSSKSIFGTKLFAKTGLFNLLLFKSRSREGLAPNHFQHAHFHVDHKYSTLSIGNP